MASDTSKGGQPVPRPHHLLSKFYLHSFPGSFQSVQWQNKGQWAQTGTREVPPECEKELLYFEHYRAPEQAAQRGYRVSSGDTQESAE